MKVALDTNGCYTTQAGTSRYVRGLLSGLQLIERPDCDYFEFAWPVYNLSYRQPIRGVKTVYRELIWSRLIAPVVLSMKEAELLHITAPLWLTHSQKIPTVCTLHDLAALRHPEKCRRWMRFASRRFYKSIKSADRIICISRFTADEGIRLLDLPPKKLDIVYHGSDFDLDNTSLIPQDPGSSIPERFFLFIGSLEPGKNLSLLRQVYELALSQNIDLPPLCIVGARWEGVPGEGMAPESWIYLGRRPDDELVYLYQHAIALVFPSKYEGFGLPVLEAMSLGCPVICSPVASLPEVAGEAPYYCPHEAKMYLRAMKELAQDISSRNSLITAGLIQARNFSWKKCAQETVDVYRRALWQ